MVWSQIQKWKNNPKFRHFRLLVTFLIFKVFLVALDIWTDINTAYEFFGRGDFYWGICTTLPIFAPFVTRIFLWIIQLSECIDIRIDSERERWSFKMISIDKKKTLFKIHLRKLSSLFWHFPALLPIR